ncbi:MAG: peptidoglycan DD-metalloendopeptidase family protein [Nitrospirae bacterium]|nr:peptidoglycan DD-metalloendopeptidase family protein [Nitrospirota bacterium]
MKKLYLAVAFLAIIFFLTLVNLGVKGEGDEGVNRDNVYREISGVVKRGETFSDIFKRYRLNISELFELRKASADIHKLKNLKPGQPYKISLDERDQIKALTYLIDDDNVLTITRTDSGFSAEKEAIEYEKRLIHMSGSISNNLISSIGNGKENLMLALTLSDIFGWDIDFTSDLRKGDTFKIIVEGLYRDDQFKKYGDIICAEFINDGQDYKAYRYEHDGETDYYDDEGGSLRRSFLKSPLSFRRISSSFSLNRFHPILKTYRPHHGVDYASPAGTPVSVTGDGVVHFAGLKGSYGKLVIIKHPNGYKTYYGHLSSISRGVKKGKRLTQGEVIGKVGATGIATGPHLHYEMRIGDRPVNPLTVKLPKGKAISERQLAEFNRMKEGMQKRLAAISTPDSLSAF